MKRLGIVPGIVAGILPGIVAGIVAPHAASAQEPVPAETPPPAWFGGIFYDGDYFTGSSPVWTDWWAVRGVATRRFDGGSVGLEAATTHRFDLEDESLAGEAYLDLWSGAYAHLRGRAASDARLLPRSDWRVELFHALPGGWEGSASMWLMNMAGPDVEVAGLGLARYVGSWYLRSRGTVAEIAGERAGSAAVFARRFLGSGGGRQYVEAGGGVGSEVVIVGAGPVLEARDTWFVSAGYQRFVFGPLGLHLSAGVNDFEGIPLRRHLTAGLVARF